MGLGGSRTCHAWPRTRSATRSGGRAARQYGRPFAPRPPRPRPAAAGTRTPDRSGERRAGRWPGRPAPPQKRRRAGPASGSRAGGRA
ncbi:hypothetical protein B8W89_10670 [Micrococcus luteus]|nr:hypothetical protein B8W89_10670 [Micrococcus luteus]